MAYRMTMSYSSNIQECRLASGKMICYKVENIDGYGTLIRTAPYTQDEEGSCKGIPICHFLPKNLGRIFSIMDIAEYFLDFSAVDFISAVLENEELIIRSNINLREYKVNPARVKKIG